MSETIALANQYPDIMSWRIDGEFDAVSFMKNEHGVYVVNTLVLNEAQNDYEVHDMGQKFIMMFLKEDNSCEFQEAILGDPSHIIRNFMRGGAEGLVVKKCSGGLALVDRLMEKFSKL